MKVEGSVHVRKLHAGEVSGAFTENRLVFDKASTTLSGVIEGLSEDFDPARRYMISFLILLFGAIRNAPDKFDLYCSFNLANNGDRLVALANNLTTKDLSSLEDAFSLGYMFLAEYQLMSPEPISEGLVIMLDKTLQYEFGPQVSSAMKYAETKMIVRVVRDYIHHPKMVQLRGLPDLIDKSERERLTSEAMLAEREDRVTKLKENLDKYKTAFNFVGLYDGFFKLRTQKRIEGAWGFCGCFL